MTDADGKGGSRTIALDESKGNPGIALFKAQVTAAAGSPHWEANIRLVDQLRQIFAKRQSTSPSNDVAAALAHMLDFAPRDGVEGMLAAQMVGVHEAAMNLLSVMCDGPVSLEVAALKLSQATRLLRLFTLQLEALNAYRGRAPREQKVTVRYVHVHNGGQAVVGAVSSNSGGGERRVGS
jgi:hypothetical protein